MKRFILTLGLAVSLLCQASKYTPEMYMEALEPTESEVPAPVVDSVIVNPEAPANIPVENAVTAEPAESKPASPEYKDEDGKKLQHQYLIVVGSFKEKLNARNLADQLIQKGEGAPYIAVSPEGMYRVVYISSNSESEIRKALETVKESYPSAWLLNIDK